MDCRSTTKRLSEDCFEGKIATFSVILHDFAFEALVVLDGDRERARLRFFIDGLLFDSMDESEDIVETVGVSLSQVSKSIVSSSIKDEFKFESA